MREVGDTLPFLEKTTVIVGGSRGIGRATALELARLVASVCIIARNEVVLREVKEELEKNRPNQDPRMHCISTDGSIEGQLSPSLASFVDENGCDIFINCVGGAIHHYIQDIPSPILRKL